MCEGSQIAFIKKKNKKKRVKTQMNTFVCQIFFSFSKSPRILLWSNCETIPSNGFHKRYLNGESSMFITGICSMAELKG